MASKTAVIAFGRMNPPTTGHAKLIQFIADVAKRENATPIIFASTSQDAKKNPLPFGSKVLYLKMMFPSITFNENENVRTPVDALVACSKLGYRRVLLVVGSDRVASFQGLGAYVVPKISKKFDKSKHIDLDEFQVVAVPGERDPDADDVSGMSASKMRAFAAANDFKSFQTGVPTKNKELAKRIFLMVQAHMGIKPTKGKK